MLTAFLSCRAVVALVLRQAVCGEKGDALRKPGRRGNCRRSAQQTIPACAARTPNGWAPERGVRVEWNEIQSSDLPYLYFTMPGVPAVARPGRRWKSRYSVLVEGPARSLRLSLGSRPGPTRSPYRAATGPHATGSPSCTRFLDPPGITTQAAGRPSTCLPRSEPYNDRHRLTPRVRKLTLCSQVSSAVSGQGVISYHRGKPAPTTPKCQPPSHSKWPK